MSFSPVRNVRIKSLTPGASVQLRLGKAAVKSPDDVTVEAKLLRHYEEGEKSLAAFQETGPEGQVSETIISRFPGAAWRAGDQYVSLVGVDESTFTVTKSANPVATDSISKAIALVEREHEDVFGAEQLIALLKQIQEGKRVGTEIKTLAIQLAAKLIDELESLPDTKVPGE